MIKGITNSPEVFKEEFKFLSSKYSFNIIEEEIGALGFFRVYANDFCKIAMSYDYRDNFFTIALIKGRNTIYPNDSDTLNIKYIKDLVVYCKLNNFNLNNLQPTENDYKEALKFNSEILEKCGSKIFQGKDWFRSY